VAANQSAALNANVEYQYLDVTPTKDEMEAITHADGASIE
jgi:hypothetical protein